MQKLEERIVTTLLYIIIPLFIGILIILDFYGFPGDIMVDFVYLFLFGLMLPLLTVSISLDYYNNHNHDHDQKKIQ